ncbi:MAG: HIT domain-containing protein [Alphaproteobacteria bacterium]|nr:HIT domain-containing protein [Alphaproteobacteria bacterium]
MPYDTNNIFARILRGEIPCNKVYENDHALAFNDIHPQAPTHILVIPKGPYVSMTDFSQKASAAEQAAFFAAIAAIVAEKKLDESGYRTIANTGVHGGQEVPHFHIHILAGKKLGRMVSAEAA